MKEDDASQFPEAEGDADLMLETLVAAHYLALQMKMLTRDVTFRGGAATGFLAGALSEWARMVEEDLFEDDFVGVRQPQASQPVMKLGKH